MHIPEELILAKIYEIRGQKVMIDRDLAQLYSVPTKVLKQAVRRKLFRFPEDFMFEMSDTEFQFWRSQIVTSSKASRGLRYAPFCFTEQGVTMLSCVLNSDQAVKVNIQIIRIFVKMRNMIQQHQEILKDLEEIRNSVSSHDEQIELIFQYIQKLEAQKSEPRNKIGYKQES